MTYGFIGTGNMGGALARALVKTVSPTDIFLNNRTMARAEALAAELGTHCADAETIASSCGCIFSGRKAPFAAGRAGAAASDPDGAGGQAPAGVHGGGRDHRGHRAGRARQRRGAGRGLAQQTAPAQVGAGLTWPPRAAGSQRRDAAAARWRTRGAFACLFMGRLRAAGSPAGGTPSPPRCCWARWPDAAARSHA